MAKRGDTVDDLQLVRLEEAERTPQGKVRRWLAELEIANRAESSWRKYGAELWDRYEAERAAPHAFNVFWSTTEILSAAIYNSTPQPDVRRRFRDPDPIGKTASLILERALSYEIDDYAFDDEIAALVLDVLVVGRGVPWVEYRPVVARVGGMERIVDQRVEVVHVQWDDFRRGPGKCWRDVPWVARRHEFTFDMAVESFGEQIARALTYEQGKDTENAGEDRETRAIFKVAEVWEIWDKDRRRVLFISPDFKDGPCKEVPDPLGLKEFFPCPRPAYAIRNSRTLVPTPLFKLYEKQAKELDRISARINRIVEALKVRGAYASQLSELENILSADDLEMVPIQNPAIIGEMGGLDRAIWLMPVEKLVQVLRGLYEAREQCKQAIYEIVGISDILRGASDPNETARAQMIKSRWGSIRVQQLQREIQRMVRDVIRLKAEIIAERFTAERLRAITQINLPSAQVKQTAQQAAAQFRASNQPVPPDVQQALAQPSMDEVIEVLRSDQMRCYRIDIETDSTVAETIERDMQGLSEVLNAVGQVLASVRQGVPIEVAKQVALAICRRARLGRAVEDALETFEMPPPGADEAQALEAARRQILDLIRAEGERQAREKDQLAERQAGLEQYDAEVRQTLGALAQATQQAMQTGLIERQALAQLASVLQQLGQAQQQSQAQVAQALGDVGRAIEQVIAAVNAPKRVTFERGADGRITGATARPQ